MSPRYLMRTVLLALAVFASPWIWLGTAGLAGFMILFAITLSWADLSLMLPVASVEIILNVALAAWLLREPVSAVSILHALNIFELTLSKDSVGPGSIAGPLLSAEEFHAHVRKDDSHAYPGAGPARPPREDAGA